MNKHYLQPDLCEFEASLVYRGSSRTVRTVRQKNAVSNHSLLPPPQKMKANHCERIFMSVKVGMIEVTAL